ncbi:MAG: DUF4160 domain-containing protein [Chloroflexi bacterium]|nr:DUF4160 domain-containing protein [Chloroflexota bacterium]
MPNALKTGPHRFFFFSREGHEPPHIHVETGENAAKFWLSPVALVWSVGYNPREVRRLRELVEKNAALFLERWYEYFSVG